jgi:hypothetical protein
MWMISRTARRQQALLIAAASLAAGFAAAAPAASADAQPPSPQAVKTNIPGVYAYTQPPPGFNPMTASNAALKAWGYPARPTVTEGAEALARWADEVNPALRRVVPELLPRKGVFHRPAIGLKIAAPRTTNGPIASFSSNWSGMALVPMSGGQPFNSVSGRWIVPTVQQAPNTCSGGWDYSSQWVGIGGFADADLVQAGSAANVFCEAGTNIPEYLPWIEWLPNSEIVLYQNAATKTPYPFNAGDYVIVTVTATNFSGGVSTSGTLYYANVTKGWIASLTFTAASLGGSQATGESAEWIVERTEVGGQLAVLPDYTADPWWNATATDLSNVVYNANTAGMATAYKITMHGDKTTNVSYVRQFGANVLWFFTEGSAVQ